MKHLKRFRTKEVILTLLFALLFFACEERSIAPEKLPVEASLNHNAILPYDFDWEDPNLNFMPYPAGQPAIPVPWVGQGSLVGVIADDVLADRKKSDGWKLVYSTFSPTIWNKNPYFMLYNEYRGLLRIFLYVNDMNTFASSTYLQDGIMQATPSTRLLNFLDKDIVDVSSPNVARVDRIQPRPFNGSPLANNKWYFLQYELAYDPSIVPTTSPNPPQLSFYINSVNVTKIRLGGTLEAVINGTIGASSTSAAQNFWNQLTDDLENLGKAGLSVAGVQAIDQYTTDTGTGANKLSINDGVWKALHSGISSALSNPVSNIPGSIVNVLSAVFGGGGDNMPQTVNLTLSGDLEVEGTEEEMGSLPSQPTSFYIPGSVMKDSNGEYTFNGYAPLYNKSLGIFNLANKPTITIQKNKNPIYGGQYAHVTSYSIKPGTLNIQFNPVVNGQVANIDNLKTEILVVLGNNYKSGFGTVSGGRTETINGEYAVTSTQSTFYTTHIHSGIPSSAFPNKVYLRISFVVSPNDGAPKSAIVKTFAVNIETTSSY